MNKQAITAALLAASLMILPCTASASGGIPTITPPCETTLYYSSGTLYVQLNESVSHGSVTLHRSQPEGDFLYYQYTWGAVDETCLAFPLIEGDYYLTLTCPSDGQDGTESVTVPFSIADPDMDPDQSFDATALTLFLTCNPEAAEDSIASYDAVLNERILAGEIYAELARQPFALGDIGADGAINAVDAASILVESAVLGSGGGTIFSDFELMQADVNLDGTMNAEDAAVILSYAAECASGNFSGSLIAFQS